MFKTPELDEGLSEPQALALSALADGECAPEQAQALAALWASNEQARQRWYELHCMADVMRSPDLASDPAHDEAFLQAFRARLASEPVVLVPSAAAGFKAASLTDSGVKRSRASLVGRWRWAASGAAGVAVVALGLSQFSILGVGAPSPAPGMAATQPTQFNPSPSVDAVLVSASQPFGGKAFPEGPAQGAGVAISGGSVTPRLPSVGESHPDAPDVQLIRDARLDRYLAAHQGYMPSSPLAEPAAHLRNVAVQPQR